MKYEGASNVYKVYVGTFRIHQINFSLFVTCIIRLLKPCLSQKSIIPVSLVSLLHIICFPHFLLRIKIMQVNFSYRSDKFPKINDILLYVAVLHKYSLRGPKNLLIFSTFWFRLLSALSDAKPRFRVKYNIYTSMSSIE